VALLEVAPSRRTPIRFLNGVDACNSKRYLISETCDGFSLPEITSITIGLHELLCNAPCRTSTANACDPLTHANAIPSICGGLTAVFNAVMQNAVVPAAAQQAELL
jgi:hypothetical protein